MTIRELMDNLFDKDNISEEERQALSELDNLVTDALYGDEVYVIGFSPTELIGTQSSLNTETSEYTITDVVVPNQVGIYTTLVISRAVALPTKESAEGYLKKIKSSNPAITFENVFRRLENKENPKTLDDLKIYKLFITEPRKVKVG